MRNLRFTKVRQIARTHRFYGRDGIAPGPVATTACLWTVFPRRRGEMGNLKEAFAPMKVCRRTDNAEAPSVHLSCAESPRTAEQLLDTGASHFLNYVMNLMLLKTLTGRY